MNHHYIITDYFYQQIISLQKKYPQIKKDLDNFLTEFNQDFETRIGPNLYKCRVKNSSIPRGKRWWFRVIVYTLQSQVPVLVYSKTDKESISKKELEAAVTQTIADLQNGKYSNQL